MNLKIIRSKHFLLVFHLRDKIQVFLQLILKILTSDVFMDGHWIRLINSHIFWMK